MNITTLIIENLRAMGANPEQITRPDGETVIKVNAPAINNERIGNNEKISSEI